MAHRAPTPRELAAMASRFPACVRTLPLRPWNASRIAAAFRRKYDDADGALHTEGGRAAAALAILFRLDPCARIHARRSEAVRFILAIDPVGLLPWWTEEDWQAFMRVPLRWRRLR
jgi:hypothetical protein